MKVGVIMYPKIGQNIVMNIVNRSEPSKSLIADIGEEEMLIALPMNTELIGLLSADTKLEITYIADENKYRFKTRILGRKKDSIPLFRVVKPSEKDIFRIQMRENFRVNTNLRVLLNNIEQTTVNLSAGGVLCSCKPDFEVTLHEEVTGTIFLPIPDSKLQQAAEFKGEVIRVNQVPKADRINVALKFIEMERGVQTKVIQYCFERQRQERMTARKGIKGLLSNSFRSKK